MKPKKTHVLALGLGLFASAGATAQVYPGDPAPDFAIADARDTGIKNFKAVRGKVLMLDFFATW